MPFEEKMTWVNLVVTIVVPVWYFITMAGRLDATSAADAAWQKPMLIAFGITIGLTILGAIAVSIVSAASAQVTGRPTDSIDRKDERDKSIGRRGDVVGFWVASAGAIGVLVLTMLESAYFWIASALYLTFVLASLASCIVKLVIYRRGF